MCTTESPTTQKGKRQVKCFHRECITQSNHETCVSKQCRHCLFKCLLAFDAISTCYTKSAHASPSESLLNRKLEGEGYPSYVCTCPFCGTITDILFWRGVSVSSCSATWSSSVMRDTLSTQTMIQMGLDPANMPLERPRKRRKHRVIHFQIEKLVFLKV